MTGEHPGMPAQLAGEEERATRECKDDMDDVGLEIGYRLSKLLQRRLAARHVQPEMVGIGTADGRLARERQPMTAGAQAVDEPADLGRHAAEHLARGLTHQDY